MTDREALFWRQMCELRAAIQHSYTTHQAYLAAKEADQLAYARAGAAHYHYETLVDEDRQAEKSTPCEGNTP